MSTTRGVDTQALKDSVNIVDVIGSRVEIKRQGKDHIGLCPFHGERSPSFTVSETKQFFHCFGCGAQGDVIKFIMDFENVEFPDACKILGAPQGERIIDPDQPARARQRPMPEPERVTCPPPPGAPPPPINGVTGSWEYRTPEGDPWFYVTRVDVIKNGKPVLKPNGKHEKQYYPWSWSEQDGWKQRHASAPRPLYGLERLAVSPPSDPVVLVEGEKCCNAAEQMFPPNRCPMTWPGGSQAVSKIDWTPLKGRRVFIWPDPDAAGTKCTAALCDALRGIASEVWIWRVSDMPETFDAGEAIDQGWTYAKIQHWSRETVAGEPRLYQHVYEDTPQPAAILAPENAPEPPRDPDEPPRPPRRVSADIEATREAAKNPDWSLTDWGKNHLIKSNETGKPIRCIANVCVPFRHAEQWRGVIRWDEMAQVVRVCRPLPWGGPIPEQWADHHDTKAAEWLDRCGLHYTSGLVAEAIRTVAHENSFHPVRDYLNALTWDGQHRLDTWLRDYLGSPDTKFTRFVGAKWMISAVARAMRPGTQVKYSLIFIGDQDVGKSKVFRVLGGKWFGAQVGEIKGEAMKAREQASKLWIIESAELSSIKHADEDAVKSFFSEDIDTYRPAYGRHVMTIPRCCVFCGTSNRDELFSDETGNVRFWPVDVPGPINFPHIERDRDQLWAEAAFRYAQGETFWEMDADVAEQARAEQKSRLMADNWYGIMADWLDDPQRRLRPWFRLSEIMQGALGVEAGRQFKGDQHRAGGLLRRMGWTKRNRGGNVWMRPEGVAGGMLSLPGPEGPADRPLYED